MKKNKIAARFFLVLILSLFLTAGYAQALPNLSSFGYRSASSTSYYDLIASKLSGMFGKSPTWNTPSTPDISSLNYISRDDAIDIALGQFPGIILDKPVRVTKAAGTWIVTIEGHNEAAPGKEGIFLGGIVKISVKTGEIVSIRRLM
jgi:hypothetical protein